jgi:hypothetical protein
MNPHKSLTILFNLNPETIKREDVATWPVVRISPIPIHGDLTGKFLSLAACEGIVLWYIT